MKRVLVIVCFLFLSNGMAQQKKPTPTPTPSRGDPAIIVWVDTQYGYYHCPNSKLYGKTPQGRKMSQKDAQDRGYRPAYGTVCTAPPKTTKKS